MFVGKNYFKNMFLTKTYQIFAVSLLRQARIVYNYGTRIISLSIQYEALPNIMYYLYNIFLPSDTERYEIRFLLEYDNWLSMLSRAQNNKKRNMHYSVLKDPKPVSSVLAPSSSGPFYLSFHRLTCYVGFVSCLEVTCQRMRF